MKRTSVNNLVSLIGRPTKDMDFRQNGENSVARFSLAVDRKFSKEKQFSKKLQEANYDGHYNP